MGKSLTQKRRREAEAEQERRQEESGIELPKTNDTLPSTGAGAPPSKKARTEERRSIFVRSLPTGATSETLTAFFSEHFPVKHATVVTDPKTKASRGYGFVTFTDADDAREAKAKLDNHLLDGRRLRLDIAEPRSRPTATNNSARAVAGAAKAAEKKQQREEELLEARKAPKLIVRNLPWSIKTPQDLAKLFTMYGKVKFSDLPSNKGKMSGFGFVTLRGKKNAEAAIAAINGKVVDGRTLAVDFAVDKSKWTEMQEAEAKVEEAPVKKEKTKTKDDKSAAPKTAEQLQAEEDMRAFMANNMENLEEEEEDEEEDEEEEEEEDEDMSQDWEDDDDDDDVEPPKKQLMVDNTGVIFIRNLPFTTTDAELKVHFEKFAPVRYARIVMDRPTGRPAGTGFVCFVDPDEAKNCLRTSPRTAQTAAAAVGKHSVLQDERVDRDGRYTLGGRVLQLSAAVSKDEATRLAANGPGAQRDREKDKRKLFLLSEGTIAVGSALYNALPPNEIKMREASAKQRQTMVKSNPALHLSLTRLAVRNIPRHIDSKGLKELARRAVVGFATDVKQGVREPLAKEEIARGGQADREAEQLRRAKGKGVVKQAKVVYESDRGSKVDEAAGAAGGGKSRGYGFIEFYSHRWALTALRWLNGHAVRLDHGSKTQRLIVEFAIENANVVMRRKQLEERSRQPRAQGSSTAGGGSTGAQFLKGRGDKPVKRSGKGSLDPKAKSKAKSESDKDKPDKSKSDKDKTKKAEPASDKQEKKDAKLVARSQIIQRKRMMRKKKGGR